MWDKQRCLPPQMVSARLCRVSSSPLLLCCKTQLLLEDIIGLQAAVDSLLIRGRGEGTGRGGGGPEKRSKMVGLLQHCSENCPPPCNPLPFVRLVTPLGGGGFTTRRTIVSQCKSASPPSAPCKKFLWRLWHFLCFLGQVTVPPPRGGGVARGGEIARGGGGWLHFK